MTGLDPSEVEAARAYNAERARVLWKRDELPWPLSCEDPATASFALLVAQFQIDHGLRVDGMLGPDTLAAIRSQAAAGAEDDSEDKAERRAPFTPPSRRSSNRLIVAGEPIALPPEALAAGLRASNYADDGEHRFEAYPRRESPRHFVVHESVTRTASGVVRVLEAKSARSIGAGRNGGDGYRYGVHFILAPDGHVSQHADLETAWLVHANQLNRSSVGCEIVNPYTARRLLPPFTSTIPRQWWTWVPSGAPSAYTLPTDAQLRSLAALLPLVAALLPGLPLRFPTASLHRRRPRIPGWNDGAMPAAGVVAHRDFASHADGRYPLERMIERLGSLTAPRVE